MASQIDLYKFAELRSRELGTEDEDILQRIEVCSQSIYRWLQYCQYHYSNLLSSTRQADLVFDRVSQYRREGECVGIRYVYEANIVAFLNGLHAVLDSFPYLLNLFIPVYESPDSIDIRWSKRFVDKYKGWCFYANLRDFILDPTFNDVKGYINTTKHKYLIRISNNYKSIEFEEYNFRCPELTHDGKIVYRNKAVPRQDAIAFLNKCHDYLIPRFFGLCNNVIAAKDA